MVPLEALVDERRQGQGIGRAIVERVVELIRAEGATELLTSHVIADDGPGGFYGRLGFVPTGELDPTASGSSALTSPAAADLSRLLIGDQ